VVTVTVQEVIELLEDCNPEAELRLAHQPGWPLAFQLHGVVSDDDDAITDVVVWLVAGDHPDESPYAPSGLWDLAVWS
jgi:hypothetical protein